LQRLGVSPVHRLSFALFGESGIRMDENQQESE
jgi:hypothetical protein